MRFLGIVAIGLWAWSALAGLRPAKILFSTFSSRCPSVAGPATNSIIGMMENLHGVLSELGRSEQCRSLWGIGQSYQQLDSSVNQYILEGDARRHKDLIEQQMASNTYLLSGSDLSEAESVYLKQQILENQTELISLEAEISRFDSFNVRKGQGAQSFVHNLSNGLDVWANQGECFNSNQVAISSLVGNTLQTAALFAPPGSSLALNVGSMAIQSVLSFVDFFRFNGHLGELDDALLPTALSCVSEVFAGHFCEAQDALDLLDQYENGQSSKLGPFKGIDLLNHQVSGLEHWLKEVYAGAPINSEGDLITRLKPQLQADLLEKIQFFIQYYKVEKTRLIESIARGSHAELREAVGGAVIGLTNILSNPTQTPSTSAVGSSRYCSGDCGDSVSNPIFDRRDQQLVQYQLLGHLFGEGQGDDQPQDIPLCRQGDSSTANPCENITAYLRNQEILVSLTDWEKAVEKASKLVGETLGLVNQERSYSISLDPYTVLVGAFAARPAAGQKFNAHSGLELIVENAQRISDYLAARSQQGNAMAYQAMQTNTLLTKQLAQKVLLLLDLIKDQNEVQLPLSLPSFCADSNFKVKEDDWIDGDALKNRSFEISTCITKLLELNKRGTDVFFSKVREMVRYEINERFASGEYDREMEDVFLATREDLVKGLQRGVDGKLRGLPEVRIDLYRSQDLSLQTLPIFYEVFDKHFRKVIQRTFSHPALKTDLCFRSLVFLNQSSEQREFRELAYQACHDAEMSVGKFPGQTLKWSEFVAERGTMSKRYKLLKSPRQNICALRDFSRRVKIDQERKR